MITAGIYSFAGGREYVEDHYPDALAEVERVVKGVRAENCLTKESKEKTMNGKMLYSPIELNKEFVREFTKEGWVHGAKEYCEYPIGYYVNGYEPDRSSAVRPYRDMDFAKGKLGCEVQFGKYSFMVYNVCAKMTIFRNLGHIDAGIEIVPVKGLAEKMSTGVSYFEQFVWDLEKRGTADIDVPVMIIGINA